MWVLDQAEALYLSFRKAEATDAKAFAKEAVKVLCRYPAEVIKQVCETLHLEQDWPPHTNELRKACDKAYAPIQRRKERDRQLEEQLERRRLADEQDKKNRGGKNVADYLEKRKQQQNIVPASPDYILQQYKHWRAMYGKQVTLDPESARILDQAGLEWRHI